IDMILLETRPKTFSEPRLSDNIREIYIKKPNNIRVGTFLRKPSLFDIIKTRITNKRADLDPSNIIIINNNNKKNHDLLFFIDFSKLSNIYEIKTKMEAKSLGLLKEPVIIEFSK